MLISAEILSGNNSEDYFRSASNEQYDAYVCGHPPWSGLGQSPCSSSSQRCRTGQSSGSVPTEWILVLTRRNRKWSVKLPPTGWETLSLCNLAKVSLLPRLDRKQLNIQVVSFKINSRWGEPQTPPWLFPPASPCNRSALETPPSFNGFRERSISKHSERQPPWHRKHFNVSGRT